MTDESSRAHTRPPPPPGGGRGQPAGAALLAGLCQRTLRVGLR
jgi:hypothetical protein